MEFSWISHIYSVIYFAAMIFLIFKADEYDGIFSIIFAPITIYRMVFGSGFFFLIYLVINLLMIFVSPLFIIVYFVWHVIFSICLGKAFDAGIIFILFLIFVPGLSLIVLGFSPKHNYTGAIDLLFFMR